MKKISKERVRRLPVSQKAYEEFRARIIRVNDLFGLDPHHMLWLFEEYMYGRRHVRSGGGLPCELAFMMLRDDIDRAIARSARARENARLRRERKERERQERERAEAEAIQEKAGETAGYPAKGTPVFMSESKGYGSQKAATAAPYVISSARDRRCASDTWCGGAG